LEIHRIKRVYIGLMIISILAASSIVLYRPCIAQESRQEEEETYSISLVQTAEVGGNIREVDGKKVYTESYTVNKGDHVWNILRNKGLLEKRNLMEILEVLKRLNSSITDLDLIYPDQTIIIPLEISPAEGGVFAQEAETVSLVSLEGIEGLELYTVKKGDSLIRVVKSLYGVPDKLLYNEYLDQLKRLNPYVENLNRIYPGQKVRLPIYSPQTVRMPIMPSPARAKSREGTEEDLRSVAIQLGEIFTLIGEEWLQTGEHFIPLRSGGQINLNADSYPIINLRNGKRVIVDLYNDLPEDMSDLITSSWGNYGIVHLERGVDLKEAMNRIIILCDYKKIQGINEPLILGGDIPLRINADWIIHRVSGESAGGQDIIIINLLDDEGSGTPASIRAFLKGLGIQTVDYPPFPESEGEYHEAAEVFGDMGDDVYSLVGNLLRLKGAEFSRAEEIPIYPDEKADFSLVIKADFVFDIHARDHIIDMSGLDPEIMALLSEHGFRVLSLSEQKKSFAIVTRTLDFLGMDYNSGPHIFWAADRTELKNIRLEIPGIIFRDHEARDIFATHINIPEEITGFLDSKGYIILFLPLP
jgi:LysM repeat protein